MKPKSVRPKNLVLTRQMIRVLSELHLPDVVGGVVGLKHTNAGNTCGNCAGPA